MKKSVLSVLALSASLIGGTVVTPTQATAATWHKGMPAKLRGNWYTKSMRLSITNKHVYITPRTGGSVSQVKSIKYRYLGKHLYAYRQVFVGGGSYIGKIKVSTNYHYAKVKSIPGTFHKS